jgi:hypothetical protein
MRALHHPNTPLGGLSLAISLQKTGIPFTIYERDGRLEDRREGFGLTLTCGQNGALDKLGVLEACLGEDCPSFCHWIFNPDGKILGYYGRALTVGSGPRTDNKRSGNLRIPREILRRILLRKLHAGTVKWSKKFIGCSYDKAKPAAGLRIHFADGSFDHASVLVGADGLHSRVRSWRDGNLEFNSLPDHSEDISESQALMERQSVNKKRYLGVTAILGISRATHPLLSKQGFYIVDGQSRLFTMPYSLHPDGSPNCCMWQLSFSGLGEGFISVTLPSLSSSLRRSIVVEKCWPSGAGIISSFPSCLMLQSPARGGLQQDARSVIPLPLMIWSRMDVTCSRSYRPNRASGYLGDPSL